MVDRLLCWAKKVPAGMMLIPLMLGALIHTFFPQVLEIGSFTSATFSNAGAASIMGVQLLCLGTRLQAKTLAKAFASGAALFFGRVFGGVVMLLLFRFVFRTDVVLGVCILTAVTAVSNTNGSIYLSLCNLVGRPAAAAATPLVVINNGPMIPLLLLGAAGYVSVDPVSIIAMLLPMLIGVFLGNSSKKCGAFLDGGVDLLMPFVGFTLGAGIDLKEAFAAGVTGLVLAVVVMAVGCFLLILVDKFICKGNGAAGIAACTTGANAVAVPAAMALVDDYWAPYVADATAQVATCAVVSAVLIPIFAVWWQKKHS